jgi:predicted membrane-bound spermidine synthase
MRRYLYFTVFFSGMTTLAAEFGASRLLQTIYGSSNLVWASIIGLILVYFAIGYRLGGRWADKSPNPRTLFTIIAVGAFTLGVVPFIAQPVLRGAALAFDSLKLDVAFGAFAATLALFSIPITLLAVTSPFVIRLLVDDTSRAGNVAGDVYALSTVGSVLGAFLPTLILFALIGVTLTFLLFSGTLLLVALIGLWLTSGWKIAFPLFLMPLILAGLALTNDYRIKSTPGQIYETESAYNYIEVLADGETHYLRLNEGQGVHSQYHPTKLYYGGPWEQFSVGPLFNNPPFSLKQVERMAIVGLAAGTAARQASAVYGPIPIDGWEIDPQIIEVGREFFGMTLPNLNAYAADGRWGLEHSPYKYDIIAVDAYRPPYIPPHLTTQEFFKICADHLTDDGVLAINVGRAPNDRRLINDLAATIRTALPSVHVMDIPNTFNSMLFATKQPTSRDNLVANLTTLMADPATHPLLVTAATVAYTDLQPDPEGGMVYTDDRSPIEWVTNSLVLNFILSGGVKDLQ